MFWIHALSMIAVVQKIDGKVAMSSMTRLMDPCSFPLPNSNNFDATCQIDYHEIPWLCDPSGVLSRTESEILEHKFNLISNVSHCFCDKIDCFNPNRIKIQLILIPYSNINIIDSCLSTNPFSKRLGLIESKTHTSAAISYAREIGRRWSSHCRADIIVVYIQKWLPENIFKPLIVTLFQNNLHHLSHLPEAIATSQDANPFDTIMSRFEHAINLLHLHSSLQKPYRRHVHEYNFWNTKICGIPIWAYSLCFSLLLLVIIAVYIANVVSQKFVVQRQLQKKQSTNSMRLANDRWKSSSMGHYTPLNGQRNVKSTMMFRQFSSNDNRRKNKQGGLQKI